ncbi:tRNA-dihydrouridine synthase [Isoptericola haloaureus]|uniref:tRNA-dihydrouridine synthase n=1 Tax=Isoptericola haloaureus TaxID=1542902 RepID=A0ABU7Z4E5_9MICO
MTALFTPLTLRGTTFANRAWTSPMCMYACEDRTGRVTAWHRAHYAQFALGGAGLVVTEATAVLPEGRVTPQDAGLWNDSQTAAWATVTEAVHAVGGKIAVQLAHAGRKGGKYRGLPGDAHRNRSVPVEEGGWSTLGASDEPFGDYAPPRSATGDELDQVVRAFAASARRAVEAGFDAIELHGAHGYLLHELLSPVTNRREDDWGGGGRERLLVAAAAAVRVAIGDEVPLLVRVSAEDVAPGGLDAHDTARLARRLREVGVDLVDCSSGGLVAGADYSEEPGYQVPGAAVVRTEGGVPTAAVGRITDAWQAEQVLRDGSADAVMIGRAMLRDPHWARHAAAELDAPGAPVEPRYYRAWRGTVLDGLTVPTPV